MTPDELELQSQKETRVRIAPSPTGAPHIGLARSALFNYLYAKKNQGKFILRIEDTDEERSEKKWEKQILEGFKWLGLNWDEGPVRQSERKDIYKKYIQKLLDSGHLYYCFCSKEELEAKRNYFLSIGKPAVYEGICRNLSEEEIKRKKENGEEFVLRFKTPANKKISFPDLIRGKITYNTDIFGDFVVAKDEQTPLYNLAVVIDDFEMKITHIIRGEDHIPNTPKQIALIEALGIPVPQYIHLPLLLGRDKSKLSKRHGAKTILSYKEEGYLSEALINFLALLGWNPGDNREKFTLPELIKEFSVERIQKSGAVFNSQKLLWLNSYYIKQKSNEELALLAAPYLKKANLIKEINSPQALKRVGEACGLYRERAKILSEFPELIDYLLKEKITIKKELLIWKDMKFKEIKKALDKVINISSKIKEENWSEGKIKENLIDFAKEYGKGDRGRVLWPMRVALTGKKASAGPFEVASVLGKERTIERLKSAKKTI